MQLKRQKVFVQGILVVFSFARAVQKVEGAVVAERPAQVPGDVETGPQQQRRAVLIEVFQGGIDAKTVVEFILVTNQAAISHTCVEGDPIPVAFTVFAFHQPIGKMPLERYFHVVEGGAEQREILGLVAATPLRKQKFHAGRLFTLEPGRYTQTGLNAYFVVTGGNIAVNLRGRKPRNGPRRKSGLRVRCCQGRADKKEYCRVKTVFVHIFSVVVILGP
jgi:hypothetical protein